MLLLSNSALLSLNSITRLKLLAQAQEAAKTFSWGEG